MLSQKKDFWRICVERWPLSGRSAFVLARYGFIASILVLVGTSLSLLFFRYPAAVPDPRTIFRPSPPAQDSREDYDYFNLANTTASNVHPIDTLINAAREFHDARLLKRSEDLASAAQRYRERRGRHPPPGFDRWVAYALKNDAIIVEDYFDRIYKDIAPFWGLDPKKIALQAAKWPHIVRVRGGKTEQVGDTQGRVPWLELWAKLVSDVGKYLPDVDMPINYMDESRLLVPFEDITRYVAKEQATRTMPPASQVVSDYTGLAEIDKMDKPEDPKFTHAPKLYWDFLRATCPPGSPSRDVPAMNEPALIPQYPHGLSEAYAYRGFIQNFTAASDACLQPHLRSYHASFIEPVSMSTSTDLFPLFGGSKLPQNNELLIPGAMYITDHEFYSGGNSHGPPWAEKIDKIIWRGVASGGRNYGENFHHFQRHRLVEMLNGTTVSRLERNGARALTFEMPLDSEYDFSRLHERKIGEWLKEFADAGFVGRNCRDNKCDYVDPYFSELESIKMKEQYKMKFLPDADGNSFSARFRGFMLSTSLPLKATVYAEWHDDRLVPWLHFAPLDNTFADMYAVLDYFTRDRQGDSAAQMIAEAGKLWGEKVLRREDMALYVFRLLLEFARVCDEARDKLGFVEDLQTK
ncbi:glycosyltransferase family 90 protein [Rhypophila decipiens]